MNLSRAMISIDVQADRVVVIFGGRGLTEREFAAVARAAGRACCAIGANPRPVRVPRNDRKPRRHRSRA